LVFPVLCVGCVTSAVKNVKVWVSIGLAVAAVQVGVVLAGSQGVQGQMEQQCAPVAARRRRCVFLAGGELLLDTTLRLLAD
tara:strand:+ start:239 stop:481 length:243 start_codon:yes stop_codon:yes gene_type:complete